jgi:hypothetical protein
VRAVTFCTPYYFVFRTCRDLIERTKTAFDKMFNSVILTHDVYNDSTGSFQQMPVLENEHGHLDSLLDYCLEHHSKSSTWKRKLVFEVQLLLTYTQANPHEQNTELLFQNFAQRLQTGTFNPSTGHDPSGLGWTPRAPEEAQQIIRRLSVYLDWLAKRKPLLASINPMVAHSAIDKAVAACAETYRRRNALLGHLWKAPTGNEANVSKVRAKSAPRVVGEPPAFPDERFEELIDRGFTVGGRPSYRDQAITLLQHGGGFRVSEPMHLFIGDVTRDPSNYRRALVRIHHPSLGAAPRDLLDERGRPVKCARQEYLMRKFGLAPRVDLMNKRESGWKGVVLDEKYYMQPYWFKPDYAEQFAYVWDKYMAEVADIPLRLRNHPYAFINLYREPKGSIYALDKYIAAHARACERIGLTVRKSLGTTPHGHRHSYGRNLDKAGISPALIKKCMHHSNEQSQEIYTGHTTQETLQALEAGFARMQISIQNKG